MTDEDILELAKNCEINFSIKWRLKGGKSSNQMYWECWEDQLLKFARAIRQDGYSEGCDDGMWQESYNNSLEGIFSSNED
jgi:hypothetical protein